MKKILGIIIASVLGAYLWTACEPVEYENYGSIYGVISDMETAEILPNAYVVLSPGGKTQVTGHDGRFEFPDLEIRQYTITVQKVGYSTNRKTINAVVGESVEANISLNKSK